MKKSLFIIMSILIAGLCQVSFAAHNVQADAWEGATEDAIPEIIAAASLMDPESMELKVKAIQKLGELKAKAAVPVLIECLGYGSETILREGGGRELPAYKVRVVSAKALADIGDERAVKPLSRAALADKDNIARRAAVQALGLLGEKARSKQVLSYLYDILEKTKDNSLAYDICESLGKINDTSSFVHLLRVTQGRFLNNVKAKAQDSIAAIDWKKKSVFEVEGE